MRGGVVGTADVADAANAELMHTASWPNDRLAFLVRCNVGLECDQKTRIGCENGARQLTT